MRSAYDDVAKDALFPRKRGVLSKSNKYFAIAEVKDFSAEEVRQLRLRLRLSTSLFASLFAVSEHTVEAWERGVNTPSGPARRLMTMLTVYPDILIETRTVLQTTGRDTQSRQ